MGLILARPEELEKAVFEGGSGVVEAVERAAENCFVFRTSDDEFVQQELKQGRLRQGWSPVGTSLLDGHGNERPKEDWGQAYVAAWNEDPSSRRWGILRRMLDIQVGDFVLCPKAPAYGEFTIARVSEPYRFEVAAGQNDYGHIIPVQHQRAVSNAYNEDSVTISDMFRSAYFRPPVAQVQTDRLRIVLDAAIRLLNGVHTSTPRGTYEIRKDMYDEGRRIAARSLMKQVADWSFGQFEAAVGHAFERKGYEWLAGNSSRNGGDADHVFSMPMPGFEDFESDSVPVLVIQVKHKQGVDNDDIVGVNQLVNWNPDQDSGWEVKHKVLFSSADSFTDECRHLAESHRVMLVCGIQAGLFML